MKREVSEAEKLKEERERAMIDKLFIDVIIDHGVEKFGTRTAFASAVWPAKSDPLRKLNHIQKANQRITLYDVLRFARMLGEPMSHIILDMEARLREKPELLS